MTNDKVMAAWRDASFWNNPGHASRYHVMIDGMGACDSRTMLLISEKAVPAETVAATMRCQRPGCKRRWPEDPPTPRR